MTSPAQLRSPRGLTAVPMIAHISTNVPIVSAIRPGNALPLRKSLTVVAP